MDVMVSEIDWNRMMSLNIGHVWSQELSSWEVSRYRINCDVLRDLVLFLQFYDQVLIVKNDDD